MAVTKNSAPGAPGTPATATFSAFKEAAIAGAVAFLLFVAIVGVKLETAQGNLFPNYRLGMAIGLSLAVAIIRLVLDLLLWRKPWRAPSTAHAATHNRMNAWLAALAGGYLTGGIVFMFPSVWKLLTRASGGIFSDPSWQERAQKAVELLGLLLAAVFVIVTAMALVMVARRVLAVALPGYFASSLRILAAPSAPASSASASLTAEFGQQLTPAMLIIAVILPILVAGPQQAYAVDTAVQVLIYIMLGWGLNIVVGLAGLLDLGYVAFYAIGAYSYVLLSTAFGWSFWLCLPLAAIFASLWGVILGFPVLRLRGDYLAIVTLAFGEIIRIVAENWSSLTNGPRGMPPGVKPTFFGLRFERMGDNTFHEYFGIPFDPANRIIFLYYVAFVVVIGVYFVTSRLRTLPIGRAWEALREDEVACRSLGINTVTTKLTAFAMGALFGGLAGPFFAARQGYITPESFKFDESAMVLAIVVLGGLGSQMGIVIAAAILVGSSEFFRDLEEYRMIIFGMAMVVIMVWRPRGIVSTRTPTVVLKASKAISGNLVREGTG